MVFVRGESKIILGGWYQRTKLHLQEIYDFLTKGFSELDLSKEKLKIFRKRLNLKSVKKESSYLDYISAVTHDGIEIKYYEDGLYILEVNSSNIEHSEKLLRNYFENFFKPAINYLFSLGAPTPKILSNIKDDHAIVIRKLEREHNDFKIDGRKYGRVIKEVYSKDMSVYTTDKYIFIIGLANKRDVIDLIVEMEIFFREFKEQLHKYLNIHRKIWEEIADIKERKIIKGKEADFYRSKLESYKKNIILIESRINQMSSYAHTRASLSKIYNIEEPLRILFQYKFEDLFNTLSYIKEIWKMTLNYVNSAISVISEISNKNSMAGIRSIQVLASIGVITAVINLLTKDTLPVFTTIGLLYLIGLIIVVFIVDFMLKKIALLRRYKLKFNDIEEKL
ncbi:MAG: hypothetical protein QXW97_02945 [Candidatus Pacearchaeota archaeon]